MKKTRILIIILIVLSTILTGVLIWGLFVTEDIENKAENTVEIETESIDFELIDDIIPAYPIGYKLNILKENYESIELSSSNESVAVIENGCVLTIGKGYATITATSGNNTKSIKINVTDLYTLPDISRDKPFLKETICDEGEAAVLDDVLAYKIYKAGYKTRAGVVAAARFLSLEFPYKLAYFSESGRLDNTTGTAVCDGEGRYYHKGLYLSEDKYDDIEKSMYGPKYWGLFFIEDTTDDHSKDDFYLYDGFVPADIGSDLYLSKRPNGLDCSGFVSWCYLNGGFDFGDMGAGGIGSYGMTDLGELVYITDELVQSDRIKAGDLIGYSSHVGIVIGVEEDYIWVADTLPSGLKVTKYERNKNAFEALGKDAFKYVMLMDDEYIEDGNYTSMW